MSQMPSKIWLHKDTKYSTGDIVCGYQYDFVQGIEDEGGIENFVEYVPADAFIQAVADWMSDTLQTVSEVKTPSAHHVESIPALGIISQTEFIEKFKKEIKFLID